MAQNVYQALNQTHDFIYPVQANEIFLRLTEEKISELQSQGFEFHVWPGSTDIIRLVFSHATKESDVILLINALKS